MKIAHRHLGTQLAQALVDRLQTFRDGFSALLGAERAFAR
jgi:hypothetical protein